MNAVITSRDADGEPIAVKRGSVEFRIGTRVRARGWVAEAGAIDYIMRITDPGRAPVLYARVYSAQPLGLWHIRADELELA